MMVSPLAGCAFSGQKPRGIASGGRVLRDQTRGQIKVKISCFQCIFGFSAAHRRIDAFFNGKNQSSPTPKKYPENQKKC
jgi:hypothetical protein